VSRPAEKMNPMEEMELVARAFAQARTELAAAATEAERELQAVREKHGDHLRCLLGQTVDHKTVLEQLIADNPGFFDKPKTRVVDGIKFGLRKKQGKVEVKDPERTIERIRRFLPEEQAELLVRVREEVDLQAVKDLQVSDLKRLGIGIIEDTDVPVVKPVDPDVDKLIAAATRDLEVK